MNFLFKEIEEGFFKGVFRDRFLKGKSSRGLPREAVKHRNADFHAAVSVSSVLLGGRVLLSGEEVGALPVFQRAEPAFSLRVQRDVVRSQGYCDHGFLSSLKLPGFLGTRGCHEYSLPWVNSCFYPKIRMAGWVTTKEMLAKASPFLGATHLWFRGATFIKSTKL